jgi:hypothetical protein
VFRSPQNSTMVLRCGAFEKWLGHESRSLMNGIGILIKGTLENLPHPSVIWGYSQKMAPGRVSSPDTESVGIRPCAA